MNTIDVDRQRAILKCYDDGLSLRDIATEVRCAVNTAKRHLRLCDKYRSRAEAQLIRWKVERREVERMSEAEKRLRERYGMSLSKPPGISCEKKIRCVDCPDVFGIHCPIRL